MLVEKLEEFFKFDSTADDRIPACDEVSKDVFKLAAVERKIELMSVYGFYCPLETPISIGLDAVDWGIAHSGYSADRTRGARCGPFFWDILNHSGFMKKLYNLNVRLEDGNSLECFCNDFPTIYRNLYCYLDNQAQFSDLLSSGALALQASTWLSRATVLKDRSEASAERVIEFLNRNYRCEEARGDDCEWVTGTRIIGNDHDLLNKCKPYFDFDPIFKERCVLRGNANYPNDFVLRLLAAAEFEIDIVALEMSDATGVEFPIRVSPDAMRWAYCYYLCSLQDPECGEVNDQKPSMWDFVNWAGDMAVIERVVQGVSQGGTIPCDFDRHVIEGLVVALQRM